MPGSDGNLVLLADEWTYAELLGAHVLPEDRFHQPDPMQNPYFCEDTEDAILRLDPAWFTPDIEPCGEALGLDSDGLDELYVGLLHKVLCHVVVLGGAAADREAAESRSRTNLSNLRRWYETFEREFARRVTDKRASETDHVVILVATEELDAREWENLRYFIESGGERPFSVTYVMLPRLEIGHDHILHAAYVWPLCVSRLLERFLLEIPNLQLHRTAASQPRGRIWRSSAFVPDLDGKYYRDLEDQAFQQLHDIVVSTVEDGDSGRVDLPLDMEALDRMHGFENVDPVSIEERADNWEEYDPHGKLTEVTDTEAWAAACDAKGRAAARSIFTAQAGLSAEHLGTRREDAETPVEVGVNAVWQQVASHPAALFRTVDCHQPRPPGTTAEETAAGQSAAAAAAAEARRANIAQWSAVLEQDRQIAADVRAAGECADTLTEAQHSFVEFGFRLVFALAATMLVGFLGFTGLRALVRIWSAMALGRDPLLLGWLAPGVVAGAALLGGVVGIALPWLLERHRGEIAVGRFREILAGIVAAKQERHRMCIRLQEQAGRNWLALRATSIVNAVRTLVERLRRCVDIEMRPAVPVVAIEDEDEAMEPDDGDLSPTAAQRDIRRRRQRRLLTARSCRRIPAACCRQKPNLAQEEVKRRIDSQINHFLNDWRARCSHWDRRNRGAIPLKGLIPFLRDSRESFEETVRRALGAQFMRHLDGGQMSQWLPAQFQTEAFEYFVSCIVPEGAQFRHRLFVRADWAEPVNHELSDREVIPLEKLQREDTFALQYDEAVAVFDFVDGRVRVTEVRPV